MQDNRTQVTPPPPETPPKQPEGEPSATSPRLSEALLKRETRIQNATMEAHLGTQNNMNTLAMVLTALLINIPAFMGVNYLLNSIPLAEGMKTAARMASMIAISPAVSSLRNFINNKFTSPVLKRLLGGISSSSQALNRRAAAAFTEGAAIQAGPQMAAAAI